MPTPASSPSTATRRLPSGGGRGLHLGGRSAPASTARRPTRPSVDPDVPTCSTTSRASSPAHRSRRRETEGAAEAACRLLDVPTSCCPPCSTRSPRWRPMRRSCTTRRREKGNIYVLRGSAGGGHRGGPRHPGRGRQRGGRLQAADAVHEMTYSTSRVQHVHLETHGSIAWRGDDGRIHVAPARRPPSSPSRSSATSSACGRATLHVFTERVGGASAASRRCCPRTSACSPCSRPVAR